VRLLLDHGNTRIKWAIEGAGVLITARPLDAADPALEAQLRDALRDGPPWSQACWVSVGDARVAALIDAVLAERVPSTICRRIETRSQAAGVRIAYPEPARLGADRFVALVGAHTRRPMAQLIVGAGTALTLDLLAADGQHRGGLIAPGPRLMRDSLVARTQGIRPRATGQVVDWATDTDDAIQSGAWLGAAALVERSHRRAQALWQCDVTIVLHGGDAAALGALIEPPCEQVDGLIFTGLARLAGAPQLRRQADRLE